MLGTAIMYTHSARSVLILKRPGAHSVAYCQRMYNRRGLLRSTRRFGFLVAMWLGGFVPPALAEPTVATVQ